jgi:Family of unknown function (DUF6600)
MSPHPRLYALLWHVFLVTAMACASAPRAHAQEPQPPAYLTVVTGEVTLERAGESEPATANMPFVAGDRLRTGAGRVEIAFPDGTAIEVGEYSEVEAISPTRVRLIAGTMDHIQRAAAPSRSSTYLPQDLQAYGSTFDQYGSWQYDQPYGYVWFPQVGPDWRPYSYGAWSPIRSYGWTWVGAEAWAWPTHHYGRWGFARNAWFWIPGRTWGAAWVSWSFADDYVSWCPLGWNSRPVFALSIGSRRGWDYWTVPRRTFETRGYGRSYAGTYRGGSHDGFAGRESSNGNRGGRSTASERVNADRGSAADFRRPSQAGVNSSGNRDSGFATRRPSTLDTRPVTDYRRPSPESRLPAPESRIPSPDSRPSPASAVPRASAPVRGQMSPSFRAREQSSLPALTAPPQSNMPAANGGVIAVPRVGARESVGNRDSGFAGRDSGFAGRDSGFMGRDSSFGTRNRLSTLEDRQTTNYRQAPDRHSTPESQSPTPDSRRRDAPSQSGGAAAGAAAPRAMPHERAAPADGEARGQAQGRRR